MPIFCYSFEASMCIRSNHVSHNMLRNNSLVSYLIKYSLLYSTFSKAMNKITSTKERIFICLVGPSESGKSQLIFDWLKIGTFQPEFDKNFYFFHCYQPLHSQMQRKNLKFIQGVNFELIENLPNNGTKFLLKFDDSCQKNFKLFFHQNKLGRDEELQTTHIVLFKSPRDV